jgi:hypothetical protein
VGLGLGVEGLYGRVVEAQLGSEIGVEPE